MPNTPLSLAMSTSWCIRRNSHLGPALDALQALGFRRAELNSLTPAMVSELAAETARWELIVQSIHNPCPWPVDGAGEHAERMRLPELSSPDPGERTRAVALGTETIRLARTVGARAVIVHLGRVETSVPQSRLFELLRAGRRAEFEALRDRAAAEREARKGPYLRSALASIRELGQYAGEAGVALGVETRDGYHEIPSLADLDDVFAVADGLPVYYWHDVGHAEKQRHLGLGSQEVFLRRYGGRLLGVHLHDAVLDDDHHAPGKGEIDLAAVAGLLPAGVLVTLELADRESEADVQAGLQYLRRLGLA